MVEIAGCSTFCILDLTGAFSQVQISEQSKQFLTINTHKGLLRFTRMPYGAKSCPSIFQSVMDKILSGCQYTKCYVDDIIVGGRNLEECKENLNAVLQKLSEFNV